MQYAGILLVGVSILIGLSGCSAAYQNAMEICEQQARSKLPRSYETKTVNLVKSESVPDGNVQCQLMPVGNIYINKCTQGTRLLEIPYTKVVTVDVNKEERKRLENSCIEQRCPKGFMDKECSGWMDKYKWINDEENVL